jgi:hypothetical protein
MKLSIQIIIAASAVVGAGGGAGLRLLAATDRQPADLKGDAGPHAPGADAKVSDERQKVTVAEKKKDAAKKQNHADGEKAEAADYFKFSRQFVTPVVEDGEPAALIILDVMIELAPGASEAIYADEPKLRDAVLKALLAQSANGDLRQMLTAPERLEKTRAAVFESVRKVIGEEARAVLLTDVGYQPF